MSGTPVAASANTDGKGAPVNTLCPGMTRLPLGWTAEDKSPVGAKSYFSLYIPTNAGGILRVFHHGGGTLELIVPDGKVVLAKSDPRRPDELTFEVAPGRFGTFVVVAEGGTSRKVACEFEQVGVAREDKAPTARPSIPWNFYYWPSSDPFLDPEVHEANGQRTVVMKQVENHDAKVTYATLRKYARAVGKDPDRAEAWEKQFHGQPPGPRWVGHCHFGAAASILFEEPTPATRNQENFTEEELEYLAAEWFGNWGKESPVWRLKEGGPFLDSFSDLFLPMAFKPGERKDVPALEFAIRSYSPDRLAHRAHGLAKGTFEINPGLEDRVNRMFGKLAAGFYQALLDNVLGEGHALVADLAAKYPDHGPAEVWNHAVFMFRAKLKERSPLGDPNDIVIVCDLFANEDFLDPGTRKSTGLPAEVTKRGEVVPGGTSLNLDHRRSRQEMRVIFESGKVSPDNERNQWLRSTNPGSSSELYAPRILQMIERPDVSPGAKPNKGQKPIEVGNEVVGLELVNGVTAMLKIRRRYR